MSTTNGTMKSFKVTDKDGNVYVMTPVDTEARQAIDGAKNLQFDDDYFTSGVSQDQKTVNVGLNGVPLGIDSDSPLKFKQDNAQGIVFGSDAPFATAIAPEYSASSTYEVGDHCMHLGKYYECNTAISTAEAWTAAHWTLTDVESNLLKIKWTSASSWNNKVVAGPLSYQGINLPYMYVCPELNLGMITASTPIYSSIPTSYPDTYNLCTFQNLNFTISTIECIAVNAYSGKSSIMLLIDTGGIKAKIVNDTIPSGEVIVMNSMPMKIAPA